MIEQSEFALAMKSFSTIVLEHQKKQTTDKDSAKETQAKWNICVCKLCGYMWRAHRNTASPKKCPSCGTTLWNKEGAKIVKCHRCDHTWKTRKDRPTHCPRCGSRTYDREKIEVCCNLCGSHWTDKLPINSNEFSCPRCGTISRTALQILPDLTTILSEDSVTERKEPLVISQKTLDDLNNETEFVYKVQSLIRNGLRPTEAKILISFIDGENILSIASHCKIPVSDVMGVIVPYLDTVGMEGI